MKIGIGIGIGGGRGGQPPAGFAFLTDANGNRLTTPEGEFWIVRI